MDLFAPTKKTKEAVFEDNSWPFRFAGAKPRAHDTLWQQDVVKRGVVQKSANLWQRFLFCSGGECVLRALSNFTPETTELRVHSYAVMPSWRSVLCAMDADESRLPRQPCFTGI